MSMTMESTPMGKPEGWVGSDLRARAEVVQWLNSHGGDVKDPHGLIVGRMRTDLKKGRAISQLIADMATDGMIEREVNGRRTLRIRLVDDWGLLDEVREHQSWQISGVSQTQETQEVSGEVDYDALAAALLERVIKQAHAVPSQGAEVERLRQELADSRAAAKDLGAELLQVRQELHDAVKAADTMRSNLAKLEAAKDTKGVPLRDHLKSRDRALIDRLMREVPTR